jgi:hypothetical protein
VSGGGVTDDETPIPAILLPPKHGSAAPRVRVRHTNWKGIWGIVAAVVVAPNLLAVASVVPDGAPFAIALAMALATPLLAVVAGVVMAYDIRNGAESSGRLALASVTVGIVVTFLLGVTLLILPGLLQGPGVVD